MEISLSELRPKLSSVFEQVKNGQMVEVTERGKVIARIEPVYEPHRAPSTVASAKEAQKRRDDILRGVNKKP